MVCALGGVEGCGECAGFCGFGAFGGCGACCVCDESGGSDGCFETLRSSGVFSFGEGVILLNPELAAEVNDDFNADNKDSWVVLLDEVLLASESYVFADVATEADGPVDAFFVCGFGRTRIFGFSSTRVKFSLEFASESTNCKEKIVF